ncbi:MAG: type II toxin-antitoxin system VapC family toxin [Hormoscilla sp. SP5CHS1]|nr:type II toxin-antitoxin system VapC family toxin [Hormoscilla sp. SP12CHS1]MBC6454834.1 type II toxin-antitoxin system VapC family toxin [Hormoscilla sp. SP5CHS1]
MKLWILDTEHVSLIQREEPFVTKRLKKINISKVAVTVITVEEQMRGRLNSIRQASQSGKSEQILFAYANLRKTVDFYRDMNLLDFDGAASTRYAELSRQKIRIGTQDIRIAAIALSVDGILVTRNWRDFQRVPGLLLEDWTRQ